MKIFLKTLIISILLIECSAFAGRVHRLSVHSLEELEPDRFCVLTGFKIDKRTVVGFDVDGTIFDQHHHVSSGMTRKLVSRSLWKDAQHTQKEFGRVFLTREEAIQFYHERLDENIKMIPGANSRGKLIDKNSPTIINKINEQGAYTLFVTLRDADFELVSGEAEAHGMRMSLPEILALRSAISIPIEPNDLKEHGTYKTFQHRYESFVSAGFDFRFREGALYTGGLRVKGLAMRELFKLLNILPSPPTELEGLDQGIRNLIYIDDEEKNFPDVEKALSPYFDNIFLIHLNRKKL